MRISPLNYRQPSSAPSPGAAHSRSQPGSSCRTFTSQSLATSLQGTEARGHRLCSQLCSGPVARTCGTASERGLQAGVRRRTGRSAQVVRRVACRERGQCSQVGRLEVPVDDGRLLAGQVQHAIGRRAGLQSRQGAGQSHSSGVPALLTDGRCCSKEKTNKPRAMPGLSGRGLRGPVPARVVLLTVRARVCELGQQPSPCPAGGSSPGRQRPPGSAGRLGVCRTGCPGCSTRAPGPAGPGTCPCSLQRCGVEVVGGVCTRRGVGPALRSEPGAGLRGRREQRCRLSLGWLQSTITLVPGSAYSEAQQACCSIWDAGCAWGLRWAWQGLARSWRDGPAAALTQHVGVPQPSHDGSFLRQAGAQAAAGSASLGKQHPKLLSHCARPASAKACRCEHRAAACRPTALGP